MQLVLLTHLRESHMDFFAEQDLARKRSGRLVVYFLLAVVAIMMAVYFAAILGWNLAQKDAPHGAVGAADILGVIGGLTILIALGSLFRISTECWTGGGGDGRWALNFAKLAGSSGTAFVEYC